MNRSYFLAVVLSLVIFAACGQNPNVKQLSSDEFNSSINDKISLIDVRTEKEYKNGHIKNAKQISYYSRGFRGKLLQLPKNEPVYLYCYSGARSSKAANILAENGYKNVYNLERGIMEWKSKDLPLTKGQVVPTEEENKYTFEQYNKLLKSDIPVFIDFYAPWCPACKKMMPMMDQLKKEYKDKVKIVKINADPSKELLKKLEISGVPYLAFYYKGKLMFSKNGLVSKEQLKKEFDTQISKINL